jgi:hypothetical protein
MMPILSCLLMLALADGISAAETRTGATPPTGGKFYVIQRDGSSRPQDPLREGVAIGADKRLSGKSQNDNGNNQQKTKGQPEARRSAQKPSTRNSTMAVKSSQNRPPRDESAASRCEQFGFYYTKDGRCIRPALRRPAPPPVPPRAPVGVTPPR